MENSINFFLKLSLIEDYDLDYTQPNLPNAKHKMQADNPHLPDLAVLT